MKLNFENVSEEEARMKIYSVSTRHYFAFGALVSEELSYKLKGKRFIFPLKVGVHGIIKLDLTCFLAAELPKVRWVLPDSYLDVKNKDYGGMGFHVIFSCSRRKW